MVENGLLLGNIVLGRMEQARQLVKWARRVGLRLEHEWAGASIWAVLGQQRTRVTRWVGQGRSWSGRTGGAGSRASWSRLLAAGRWAWALRIGPEVGNGLGFKEYHSLLLLLFLFSFFFQKHQLSYQIKINQIKTNYF